MSIAVYTFFQSFLNFYAMTSQRIIYEIIKGMIIFYFVFFANAFIMKRGKIVQILKRRNVSHKTYSS